MSETDAKKRLFYHKNPYDIQSTADLFLQATRENLLFQIANCPEYARIIKSRGFSPDDLKTEVDLCKIPVLPTLYFKRNRLFSIPEEKLTVNATSSGTKGAQSVVGFDAVSMRLGIAMMTNFLSYHKLISLMPANYLILGYEPSEHTQMGAIKTATGMTRFAPSLHKEYALKDTGCGYAPNPDGVQKALMRYAKSDFPVRLVGFPSYLWLLVNELENRGISLKLNRHSKVLLGGGWKQFSDGEIESEQLYKTVEKTLGIPRENCYEFFSAVEHPLPYVKCKNGHFHVPIYSRAFIRDVNTLEPVLDGQLGLLSFVTPLVGSMPLLSVVTDDLAVMYPAQNCGCGIQTPYFDLKGRAGVGGIKTCTTEAAELLKGAVQ